MSSSPRLKVGLYAFLVAAVFVLASYRLLRRSDSVAPSKDQVLIGIMLRGLTEAHYQPEKVDDAFSKRVFDLYLKHLDYRKQFLLATDVEQLRRYQTQIDDEVKRGSHEFLDLSTKLMADRTKEMQGLYREILAKPFDFTVDESFQSDFEKAAFPADKAAQREMWRKLLKFETLSRMSEMMEAQEKAKQAKPSGATAAPSAADADAPTAAEPTRTPAEMEAEARKRVLKYYDEQFAEINEIDANDRLATYANTIANTYDPHTEYFAPKAKEDFDYEMTGRFEGIGATLREKEGLIYVDEIIPGSASARQGDLKKGDAIIRVAQAQAEPVSIEGWHTTKAVTLIRGKKGSEVRLTVKKPDGSTKVIPIVRDVVVVDEKYAQSSVITDKGQKIGYLRLPGFYADFNDNGGRSSSDDVKKELAKLNAEGVKGVILDLRFNGGGSLTDAVSMAGLFMESGPMVQVRDGQGRTQVLTDNDPRVQYSGPLVVLVNKYSASASEILAAAVQDYHRGIIMGSTSTYGKGTVQRIFDLDEALPTELNNVKPIGSLKLTTQKFYRVNGGSTQFKGVVSDIVVPDLYSYLDQGEKESDYPLKWDEIQPARYRPWNGAPAIDKLRANSKARVAANPSFKVMDEMVKSMRKRKDETTVSLKLSAYRTEQQQAQAISDRYEAAQKSTTALAFSPLTADVRAAGGDTVKINRASRITKTLKKDITIGEAVAVIQDELK
ncbi:carboxy terminal-processing peptidase [Hymenobacter sp. BT770]|uniref:carboxy terminal-processing peptidase n=1 Tax=Hymenobacter sp. BT770 TaxID=2886942 RepID=UPI001D0FD56F|nr:carboxy terminal-processing peptidase [Hymenobacter sp. BT770]MCC3155265.1 carboxy terminal-processing peptidase [Hymenobacter sp. BT770]MDO3417270.1 carboxy terminal-processing peptidase [Hymenobacter sp. BT770]